MCCGEMFPDYIIVAFFNVQVLYTDVHKGSLGTLSTNDEPKGR